MHNQHLCSNYFLHNPHKTPIFTHIITSREIRKEGKLDLFLNQLSRAIDNTRHKIKINVTHGPHTK